MTTLLVAVLIPADATADTIDAHLAGPMRFLMPGVITRYRLGGRFTGAWDSGYTPQTDPANWRPCGACGGTGRQAGQPCPGCADAEQSGRQPGTVVADDDTWTAHPSDVVPLTTMLADDWKFPPDSTSIDGNGRGRSAVPSVFADPHGAVWLSGSPAGAVPAELRHVWDRLISGARPVGTQGEPFDPSAWSVAVVTGHDTSDADRAALPVVGSVVLITDPGFRDDDADPDQLYVVSDDLQLPYYQLVRLGGYGPVVPGFAITEVDPARVVHTPVAEGTPPYSHSLRQAHDDRRPTNT